MIIIAISSTVENNKLLVIKIFCCLYNKILIDWIVSAYVQQWYHPRNDDLCTCTWYKWWLFLIGVKWSNPDVDRLFYMHHGLPLEYSLIDFICYTCIWEWPQEMIYHCTQKRDCYIHLYHCELHVYYFMIINHYPTRKLLLFCQCRIHWYWILLLILFLEIFQE